MHKKKNQLFRLMRALKSTEKAYFKKFSYKQEKRESPLFYLFDLIDKQSKGGKEVDEEKLEMRFAKRFPKHSYTKIKSRLLEQLLEAIREYDRKGNAVEKIFDALAQAESLKKRSLFFDAWQVLQKAEKLAEEMEMVELLVYTKSKRYYYEIFTEKYKLSEAHNSTLQGIFADVETLKNRIDADFAAYRILHFQKTIGLPRSDEDFAWLREIQAHPSFTDDHFTSLEGARLNLAVAKAGIFFSLGDTASVLRVGEAALANYAPGQKLHRIHAAKFLSLFDSFLQAALLSLQVELYENYYPVFHGTKVEGDDAQHLKTGIDLYLRSIYAIVGQKLASVPQLLAEFDAVKDKTYIPNYRKVSLAYYMIFGPMLAENPSAAYRQIQWLQNNRQLGIRADIEVGVLAMECLILLEKAELDVLEYRLRAFDELLKRKERKFAMEAAMLRLLRQAMQATNQEALQEVYAQNLVAMSEILAEDQGEKAFLHAFDVISWLESRVQQLPFSERYAENNLQKK